VSQRVDPQQMYETFRANHRDPKNLAMHLVGYWLLFRAVKRLFTGHVFSALAHASAGMALLVGGHKLEGSEPFAILKQVRQPSGDGHVVKV
jgi:hypothetical protein